MGKFLDFVKGHYASQFSNKDDGKSLGQLLQEAEAYYSPMLPKNADADTRLESVEITESEIFDRNAALKPLPAPISSTLPQCFWGISS